MKKYGSKVVRGIHDDAMNSDTYHVLITEHTLHEERRRADGAGFEVSGERIIESHVAYAEDAARLFGMERAADLSKQI